MKRDLTTGSIAGNLIRFSVPYLIACFLQTFYGMADLFITGRYCGSASISAVAIGSQVMHMLTVMIVGLAMGSTVWISRAVGAGRDKDVSRGIGQSVVLFAGLGVALTAVLLVLVRGILVILKTPAESMAEAVQYLTICFAGVLFIVAYNVIASIFRGLGDTRSPMIFVAVAGLLNIGLDVLFIGPMHMGAAGAALATVISQTVSVLLGLRALLFTSQAHGGATSLKTSSEGAQPTGIRTGERIRLTRQDLAPDRTVLSAILRVGLPVTVQDGAIQISFLVITAIANSRGVDVAAAVGVVEKIISFLFLVPSAMLSSVSAIAAQCAGAGQHRRGRKTLVMAVFFAVGFGIAVSLLVMPLARPIVGLFAPGEPEVARLGGQYLRAYVLDTIAAGIHFSFSGYFCAYEKASYSFIHNLISILIARIPLAYLASVYFPDDLYPMGLAAPLGSAVSAVICILFFIFSKEFKHNLDTNRS